MHLAGVKGKCHRGNEEIGLAIEVVVDKCGVNARGTSHRTQAGSVVTLGGEDILGGLDDVVARIELAGSPATWAHDRSLARVIQKGYSPVVNSMIKLINDEY